MHAIVGEAVELEREFCCKALSVALVGMNAELMAQVRVGMGPVCRKGDIAVRAACEGAAAMAAFEDAGTKPGALVRCLLPLPAF